MIPLGGAADNIGPAADVMTSARRARNRRFLTSVSVGFAGKVVSTIASAIIVSVAVRSLGPERYGILATITSVLGLLQFADLGLGNGIVTRLAHARGIGDADSARELVTATVVLLAVVGLAVAVVAGISFSLVDWPRLLGVGPGRLRNETSAAIAVCLALVAIGLPLGAVQDIQDGIQEGFVTSSWAMVGSVLSVGGIIVCAITRAGLPFLVLSVVGAPLCALALNGCALFGRFHPELRPSRRVLDRSVLLGLVRSGRLFLVLQAAAAVSFETDAIVIARVLGPRQVTNYIIPASLFGLISTTVAIAVSPLWGAYAEAIARRDHAWVQSTLRRSMLGVALFTIPAASALVLAGPVVVRWWAGPDVVTTWLLLAFLGVWAVLGSFGAAISMLLNAAHVVRLQVIGASTMAITNLGLSIALARAIGISGVVAGTVIAYVACIAVPYTMIVPGRLRVLLDPSASS